MFISMDDRRIGYDSTQLTPGIAAAECGCRDLDLEDMQTHLEQLQAQVVDCELIRDLTTDRAERDLFTRFSAHFRVLAAEVERAIAAKTSARSRRGNWS